MSTLKNRITRQSAPESSPAIDKDYGPIKEIPLVRIQIHANGISYDEPIVAPDGGLLMPTGRGQWGQLYAVGR